MLLLLHVCAAAPLSSAPLTSDPIASFTHCVEDSLAAARAVDMGAYANDWQRCSSVASPDGKHPTALQPSSTILNAAAPVMTDPGDGASHWLVDRLLDKIRATVCGERCDAAGVSKFVQFFGDDMQESNRNNRISLFSLESGRSATSSVITSMVQKSLKGASTRLFDPDDFATQVTEWSNNHNTQATWYTYAKRVPGLSLLQADLVQRLTALPGAAANPKYATALAAFAALGNTSTTLPYAPAAAPAPSLLQMAAGAFGI